MATPLSLTTGISAASAELPGLSALPKTRFPIAGSVGPVGQWIRDEWNLKMLRSLCSFRFLREKAFQCRRGLFGRYPKTSSGPSDLTRSLPGRALRPAFRYPSHWPISFLIKLRLSHLRGQRLLNYSVRPNSLSDTARVCRHRSGHEHYSSGVSA